MSHSLDVAGSAALLILTSPLLGAAVLVWGCSAFSSAAAPGVGPWAAYPALTAPDNAPAWPVDRHRRRSQGRHRHRSHAASLGAPAK